MSWTAEALREALGQTDAAHAAAEARRSAATAQEYAFFLGQRARAPLQERLDRLILQEKERDVDRLRENRQRVERLMQTSEALQTHATPSPYGAHRRAWTTRPIPFPRLDHFPVPLVRQALLRRSWKSWCAHTHRGLDFLDAVRARRAVAGWAAAVVGRKRQVHVVEAGLFWCSRAAMQRWIVLYFDVLRARARVQQRWRSYVLHGSWQTWRHTSAKRGTLLRIEQSCKRRRLLAKWRMRSTSEAQAAVRLQVCLLSWLHKDVRWVLNKWMPLGRVAATLRQAVSVMLNPARRHTFAQWALVARERLRRQASYWNAGFAVVHRMVGRTFRQWRGSTIDEQGAHHLFRSVAVAIQMRYHRCAFNQWAWVANEMRRRWDVARGVALSWLSEGLRRSLNKWAHVTATRSLLIRVVLTWTGLALRRTLHSWVALVGHQEELRRRVVAILRNWKHTELRWALFAWVVVARHRSIRLDLLASRRSILSDRAVKRLLLAWEGFVRREVAAAALQARADRRTRMAALGTWRTVALCRRHLDTIEHSAGWMCLRRRRGWTRWAGRTQQGILRERAGVARARFLAGPGQCRVWSTWVARTAERVLRCRLGRRAFLTAVLNWREWAHARHEQNKLLVCGRSISAVATAVKSFSLWREHAALGAVRLARVRCSLSSQKQRCKRGLLERLALGRKLERRIATVRLRLRVRSWRRRCITVEQERFHLRGARDFVGRCSQRRLLCVWVAHASRVGSRHERLQEMASSLRRRHRREAFGRWVRRVGSSRAQVWLAQAGEASWMATRLRSSWGDWTTATYRFHGFSLGAAAAHELGTRRAVARWSMWTAPRRTLDARTLTAHSLLQRQRIHTFMSHWQLQCAACRLEEPAAAANRAIIFRVRSARRSLRHWACVAMRCVRHAQMQRLLHAHSTISSLEIKLQEVETRAATATEDAHMLRSECAGLRHALEFYVPSHRRETVASRGWAVSAGEASLSDRRPASSGHAACTELLRAFGSAQASSAQAPPRNPSSPLASFRLPPERTRSAPEQPLTTASSKNAGSGTRPCSVPLIRTVALIAS